MDEGGHIRAAYDLDPNDWALVRPDGYIAAIIGPGRPEVLNDHLSRLGLSE